MNLIEAAASLMSESSFTEDYLKTLGLVVEVFSEIVNKADKEDLEKALKTANSAGLAISDNEYAKAFMSILTKAAARHGVSGEELLTDDAANVTTGIAIPSGPMSKKPLKKYKTFVVPSAVFNDFNSALGSDEYADVSAALNEGETIVLQHKDSGARKGYRLKKP